VPEHPGSIFRPPSHTFGLPGTTTGTTPPGTVGRRWRSSVAPPQGAARPHPSSRHRPAPRRVRLGCHAGLLDRLLSGLRSGAGLFRGLRRLVRVQLFDRVLRRRRSFYDASSPDLTFPCPRLCPPSPANTMIPGLKTADGDDRRQVHPEQPSCPTPEP